MTKAKLPSGLDAKYAGLPIELLKLIFFDDDPVNGPLVANNRIQLRANTPLGRSAIVHLLHAFGDIVNINNLFYLDDGVNKASGRWVASQNLISTNPNAWSDLVNAGLKNPAEGITWITHLRNVSSRIFPKVVSIVYN